MLVVRRLPDLGVEEYQAEMADKCTLFAPSLGYAAAVAALYESLPEAAVAVTGTSDEWSSVRATLNEATLLTLNGLRRQAAGDHFSKTLLGAHAFFRRIPVTEGASKSSENKEDILRRLGQCQLIIGVVAEPAFDDQSLDTIFRVATAMRALIFTGNGMLDAAGDLLLDIGGLCD